MDEEEVWYNWIEHEDHRHAAPLRIDIEKYENIQTLDYHIGTTIYGTFMSDFIRIIESDRGLGYLRLTIHSDGYSFSLIIRNFNVYINGIHVGSHLYEIGYARYGARYFNDPRFTEFGEQYYELLNKGGHYNLVGLYIGYRQLKRRAGTVIYNPNDPKLWKMSIAVFAVMFCESGRFRWIKDDLVVIMNREQDIFLNGDYKYMAILPKIWGKICEVARREFPFEGEEHQLAEQQHKRSEFGCNQLLRSKRYANAALGIHTVV
ncbi:symplekin isoform X2 [Tanacetum coccineum]